MNKHTLSVIVPVYNEELGIANFLSNSLLPELEKISKYQFELILVDDGSSDNTLEVIGDISKKYRNNKKNNIKIKVKVISFSRNFGKEAALSAGLQYSTGAAALMIDADGQQPPKLISEFISKWESGAEIVTGVRSKFTKHGLIQKIGSKMFYKILHAMGGRSTVPGSTDFRLIDRVVLDEFNQLSEHNRITRGLIDWLGFRQEYIEYEYGSRIAGKPSYNIKKLFNLAIDSFVSLSTTPLIIFGWIGLFITIASFLLGVFVIIQQYILGDPLQLYWNGSVQMAIFITFLVGLILISQAATALYISQIHTESKRRPLYVIDKKNSSL